MEYNHEKPKNRVSSLKKSRLRFLKQSTQFSIVCIPLSIFATVVFGGETVLHCVIVYFRLYRVRSLLVNRFHQFGDDSKEFSRYNALLSNTKFTALTFDADAKHLLELVAYVISIILSSN